MEKIFWLSFADSKLPKGSQFLGVAIVEAYSIRGAVSQAAVKGINPGGEVQISEIPRENASRVRPHMYKLMSKKDLEEASLL